MYAATPASSGAHLIPLPSNLADGAIKSSLGVIKEGAPPATLRAEDPLLPPEGLPGTFENKQKQVGATGTSANQSELGRLVGTCSQEVNGGSVGGGAWGRGRRSPPPDVRDI